MAAEKLGELYYIGPRNEGELLEWAKKRGQFISIALSTSDEKEGFTVGIVDTTSIEVGHIRAATPEWWRKNVTPAWGPDRELAIRRGLERKRVNAELKRSIQVFPPNVIELRPRKSA